MKTTLIAFLIVCLIGASTNQAQDEDDTLPILGSNYPSLTSDNINQLTQIMTFAESYQTSIHQPRWNNGCHCISIPRP